MSQPATWGVPTVGPASPAAVATRADDSLDALLSMHSGTSRPSYAIAGTFWLDTANASAWVLKLYDGTDDNSALTLNPSTGAWTVPNVLVVQNASLGTHALNRDTADGRYGRLSDTNTWTQANTFSSNLFGSIVFAGGRTSTASGNSGVALASNNSRFEADSAGAMIVGRHGATPTGTVITFTSGGGSVGTISVTGVGTAYNTSSDYRLKEDLEEIKDATALLMAIPVWRFRWKGQKGPKVTGFVAHELQEHVPEAVSGRKDDAEDIGTLTVATEQANVPKPAKMPEGATWKANKQRTKDIALGTLMVVTKTEDVPKPGDMPPGASWKKTGTRPLYQGADQAKLTPLLTAALQESIRRIEALEATIADLNRK